MQAIFCSNYTPWSNIANLYILYMAKNRQKQRITLQKAQKIISEQAFKFFLSGA
jgi:hypothetical protein